VNKINTIVETNLIPAQFAHDRTDLRRDYLAIPSLHGPRENEESVLDWRASSLDLSLLSTAEEDCQSWWHESLKDIQNQPNRLRFVRRPHSVQSSSQLDTQLDLVAACEVVRVDDHDVEEESQMSLLEFGTLWVKDGETGVK
jgi:hypothetical protein